MSYNQRYPIISFRIESTYKKKLQTEATNKKLSLSDLAKLVLQDYAQGKLISPKKSLDLEIAQARLEKLKVETNYLRMKNDYFEKFNKPLSDSGTRMLSRAVKHQQLISPENTQSPYDESNNRFQCVDCGNCFDFDSVETFLTEMREYKNHIIAKHNRDLNVIEKDVFGRVRFNE